MSDYQPTCEGTHDFTDPVVVKATYKTGSWFLGYDEWSWEVAVTLCRRCRFKSWNGFVPRKRDETP